MSEFAKSVDHYLEGIDHANAGPCPGCAGCGLEDCDDMEDERYELASEPSFSWSQCDGCGSTFGGDRHYAHGFVLPGDRTEADGPRYPNDPGEIIHLDVCTDCLLYLANGDEPETWSQHPA